MKTMKTMLWILPLTLAAGCGKHTTNAADTTAARTASEKNAKAEADRLAREQAAADEANRIAREQVAAEEANRLARERAMAEEEARAREQSAAPVTPPAPPIDESPTAADLALVQSVNAALLNDATLSESAKKIVVTVKDGLATLRGNVVSDDERRNIETAVRAVPGVRECDNQLEVKPG